VVWTLGKPTFVVLEGCLVESLGEVCVHHGGDVPRVVGVQQHVPGQVHRHRLTLALALTAYSGKLRLMHGNTEKLAARCGTGIQAQAHPRSRSPCIQRKITYHAWKYGKITPYRVRSAVHKKEEITPHTSYTHCTVLQQG
jgi:hypothetical protein